MRLGVKHGVDVYSGGERLGGALEILVDSVRFFHVAYHGKNSWTNRIIERDQREEYHCQYLGRCLWSLWNVI